MPLPSEAYPPLYGCLFDLRFFVVTVLKCAAKGLTFFKDLSVNEGFAAGQGPLVAVHYAEGLDTRKRSDIFWIKGSGIDPARILVYIDTSKSSKAPVEKSDCGYIRGLGASWVSLNDAAISREVPRTRIGGLRPKAGIWKFIAVPCYGAVLVYGSRGMGSILQEVQYQGCHRHRGPDEQRDSTECRPETSRRREIRSTKVIAVF